MSIAILLQQILIIFLEIGTGAAVTKLGIMDDRNSKFLSNLVMSVTLPCTLLASASIDGGREAVAGMLKGYVVLEIFYILTIGICLVLSRAMHLTRGQKAVLVGAAVMPNSAFIGIPLISALLGSEVRCRWHHGLQHPVLYLCTAPVRPGSQGEHQSIPYPHQHHHRHHGGHAGDRPAAARHSGELLQGGGQHHHAAGSYDRRQHAGPQ